MPQLVWYGNRLEIRAVSRDEHKVRRRHQIFFDRAIFSFPAHFEIQTERRAANLPNVHAYLKQIIEPRRAQKIAFEMNPRQPDIEFIEDLSVRHPDRAKQLRLGNFKETNVRAVEDNRSGI